MFLRSLLAILLLVSTGVASVPVGVIGSSSKALDALTASLEASGIKYRLHVLETSDDFPEESVFDYRDSTVIRLVDSTTPSSGITADEARLWTDYLASTGTLILMGDRFQSAPLQAGDLMRYAGLQLQSNYSVSGPLTGEKKDLISDSLKLNLPDTHTVDLLQFQNGDSVLTDTQGTVLSTKRQACGFRMSILNFLPHWAPADELAKLLPRAIDWNRGRALVAGHEAPDFPLLGLDSEPTGFFEHRQSLQSNRPMVLEFMATWCHYCATQLPRMTSLHQKFSNQVDFLFVSYKEDGPTVQSYLDSHPELDWPILISEDGFGPMRYGMKSLPGIFVIDAEGVVTFISRKTLSEERLEEEIQKALRSSKFHSLHPKQ